MFELTGLDVAREETEQLVSLRGAARERLRHRRHVQAVHRHAELVLRRPAASLAATAAAAADGRRATPIVVCHTGVLGGGAM